MGETRAHSEAISRALRRGSSTVFRFGYGVPALGPSTPLVQSSRKRDLSCSVVKVHSLLKQDCGRVQASSTLPWACPVSCLDKPQSAPRPVPCLLVCRAATVAWPSTFCSLGGLHSHRPPIALSASIAVTPLWDIRLAPQFVPSLEEFLLHLN